MVADVGRASRFAKRSAWVAVSALLVCGGAAGVSAQDDGEARASEAYEHAALAARLREAAGDDPRVVQALARAAASGAPALALALERARASGESAVAYELCGALGDLATRSRSAPSALSQALADRAALVRHAAAVALAAWAVDARDAPMVGVVLGDAVDALALRPLVALDVADPAQRNGLTHALARAGYAPRSVTGPPGLRGEDERPLAVLVLRGVGGAEAWTRALEAAPRAADTPVLALDLTEAFVLARLAALADQRAALAARTARPAARALAVADEAVLRAAAGALVRAVRTPHPDRGTCALALGRVADPAAGSALVVLLEDAHAPPAARLAAARALGARYDRGAPADEVEVTALARVARGRGPSDLADAALAALGRAPLRGVRRLELVGPPGSDR